jgi:hypothetical protein
MFWSFMTVNYTYDLKEDVFNGSKVRIINYLDVLEHSMYNSFFQGMERLMFGPGPTSPTQQQPPPASLLWWIQPYTATAGYTLPTGTTSGFVGLDPSGFSGVGPGGIPSTQYMGWRNRAGMYQQFTEDDAIDTIIECMDKCVFRPAQSYSEMAPNSNPKWELLTTYSRVKMARKIAQTSNDNLKGNLAEWKDKDVVTIRGCPLIWIPAWSNQEFGLAQTNGPVLGVNWNTWQFYTKSSLNMAKTPPYRDKDKHTVRWRVMDHSGQIVCKDRRANFIVTSGSPSTGSTITVQESD